MENSLVRIELNPRVCNGKPVIKEGRGWPSQLSLGDSQGEPIHVVWGIPKGVSSPAVLVTAYRPDPERWSSDFRRRKL